MFRVKHGLSHQTMPQVSKSTQTRPPAPPLPDFPLNASEPSIILGAKSVFQLALKLVAPSKNNARFFLHTSSAGRATPLLSASFSVVQIVRRENNALPYRRNLILQDDPLPFANESGKNLISQDAPLWRQTRTIQVDQWRCGFSCAGGWESYLLSLSSLYYHELRPPLLLYQPPTGTVCLFSLSSLFCFTFGGELQEE